MPKQDVSAIIQPGIDLGGFTLMEPTTVLTDIMVTVVCFYAFWKLRKHSRQDKVYKFTQVFFLMLGLAAFFGAFFGHGLIHILTAKFWKLPGWYTSMFAVAFLERASISHANQFLPKKLGKFLLGLNVVELASLCIIVAITVQFKYVEIHSAYGFLVVVFLCHSFSYFKSRDKGSLIFLLNNLTLFAVVFIYNHPVIIHTFFNHRDLAHLVMCLSCWLIYKGTINLGKSDG